MNLYYPIHQGFNLLPWVQLGHMFWSMRVGQGLALEIGPWVMETFGRDM